MLKRVIIPFLIIFLTLVGCGNTATTASTTPTQNTQDDSYNQVIKTIKETDWGKATTNDIQNVRDKIIALGYYKDSLSCLNFITATKYFNSGELDSAYQVVKNFNDEDYKSNIKDQVEKIKSDVYDKLFAKYSQLLNQKDFDAASQMMFSREKDGSEFAMLYNYSEALRANEEGNKELVALYLLKIPDTYSGNKAEEISTLKSKYAEIIQKERNYLAQLIKPNQPAIGMTSQAVLSSTWGKPEIVNKTTTATVVHEQWVYSNNRYIYLDNGIVTAIQDSK